MAKTSDNGGSADSWPGFLSELTKSFLILRDIFGYALPGAVFLATGLLCRGVTLKRAIDAAGLDAFSPWLQVVLGIGACYAVGHVMSQSAYFFDNFWRFPWMRKGRKITFPWKLGQPDSPPAMDGAEVTEELIKVRATHPEILTELERQSVMTQLRGSMGAAMLLGSVIFLSRCRWHVSLLIGVAGLFLLFVFLFSALPHMADLRNSTAAAGKAAEDDDKAAKTSSSPGRGALGEVVHEIVDAVKNA